MAPKGYKYQDDKILGADNKGEYTENNWGIQNGKIIYISKYTFDKGMQWLYLVTGHEMMHYSFDLLFPSATWTHQHLTISDWEIQQLGKWGITDGWMFEQSNGSLQRNIKQFPKAAEIPAKKGWTWDKTGMTLIDNLP